MNLEEIQSVLTEMEAKNKVISSGKGKILDCSLVSVGSEYEDFCKKHKFADATYLSEVITDDDISSWTPERPVYISAPTGSGKTSYLVYDKLVNLVIKSNQRILIFTNRQKLCRQMKVDLLKLVGEHPEKYSASSLDNIEEIGNNITILTYQKAAEYARHRSAEFLKKVEESAYVVYDEIHYILEDSTYNSNINHFTNEVLLMRNKKGVQIFMSATFGEIFDYIDKEIYSYEKITGFCGIKEDNIQFYGVKDKFENIAVKYFREDNQLVDLINSSDEKFLVFVSSVTSGAKIYEKITKTKAFIFSTNNGELDNNSDVALEEIINQEKFSCQVVIATSVLENGINISDKNLNNVVCVTADDVQLVQMLGRIRRDRTNPRAITLYIKQKSPAYFTKKLARYYNPVSKAISLYSNKVECLHKYFQNQNPEREFIRNFFYFYGTDLRINNPAYFKLKRDIDNIQIYLKEFEILGEDAFIFHQLNVLGLLHTYHHDNFIDADCKNAVKIKLDEFLSALCDKIITDADEIASIRKRIGDDYNIITGTKWDNHLNRLPGSEKMCELLQTIGLPYSIELDKSSKQLRVIRIPEQA